MGSRLEAYAGSAAVAVQGEPTWRAAGLITTDGNRWSRPGQPTIYLAGDAAMALAELARHMAAAEPAPLAWVWTVDVHLESVADLRSDAAAWVLDEDKCCDVASDLRQRGADGLIVPSVAFLDRPDRANLVIFTERIGDLDDAISDPRRVFIVRPS
jgi:RES domain-containing protein